MATRLPYEKLRVRLRRQLRLGEDDVLWGKRLSRRKWTVFEREEFRDGKWMGVGWLLIRTDDLFRIEGKLEGRWEPVGAKNLIRIYASQAATLWGPRISSESDWMNRGGVRARLTWPA